METHIGKLIRQKVSQQDDLTIRAFAEKLGVHEQTVYDIYKRPDISTDLLRRVADALEVPLAYFLPELAGETAAAAFVSDRPAERAPRITRPKPDDAAEPAPETRAAPASIQSDTASARPEPADDEQDTPRFSSPPAPETRKATPTQRGDAERELAWAKEKIELLEARLRDKEQLILLLKTLLPNSLRDLNGKA